ncbi:CTP synthase, partial [Candidatus Saccharibacteria bacterium]|nr:CTP synthase [Candidatus Saccharibacteria bacterium]
SPDVLTVRSESPAPDEVKTKLSLFSGVGPEAIALLPNARSIYEVPLTLEDTGLADVIVQKLGVKAKQPSLKPWREVVKRATTNYDKTVKVAVVAKYMDNQDTYMSVFEALRSAAWWNGTNVDIDWVEAENIEKSGDASVLSDYDGVLVPGGFGTRGLEGKIAAARYALGEKKPYLGLCLGLQMAVIAAARNAGLEDATTFELSPDAKDLVINTMTDQKDLLNTGGTMRLGDYPCSLEKGTLAAKVYGATKIVERHRHRGECNPVYRDKYTSWGIKASGINPDNNLVEIIEGVDHPFFLASQFHPEFKSRPNRAHPMFDGFIKACLKG